MKPDNSLNVSTMPEAAHLKSLLLRHINTSTDAFTIRFCGMGQDGRAGFLVRVYNHTTSAETCMGVMKRKP